MSSSTESSAQAALQKAKDLQRQAIDDPTEHNKREFQNHLISLCSYPSHQCKAFFGSLVARHFKEFDDLQDRAINEILDLCEDEDGKTRLIGIGGLKNTARADPRWIKGNTGVLLQLLDSPEGEVKQVHNALHTLMQVSPIETIEIFAEECRTSDSEQTESRRLILDFLSKHSVDQRRDLFSSGKYQKAEDVFRKEFERLIKPTEPFEAIKILRMMVTLSTITGENATKADAADFSRSLLDGVSANAPMGAREDIVELYGEYLSYNPPLDPREVLRFYGAHGRTFAKMALDGKKQDIKKQLNRLKDTIEDAIRLWTKGEDGPAETKILPEFSRALLTRTLETALMRDFRLNPENGRTVEILLWAVYQCHLFKDRRKDFSKMDRNDLDDLRSDAKKQSKNLKGIDRIVFENIEDMADDLSDLKVSLRRIKPSWVLEPRPAPVPATRAPLPRPRPTSPPASSVSRPDQQLKTSAPIRPRTPPLPQGPALAPVAVEKVVSSSEQPRSAPVPQSRPATQPPITEETSQAEKPLGAEVRSDLPARLSKPTSTSQEATNPLVQPTPVTVSAGPARSLADRLSKPSEPLLSTPSKAASPFGLPARSSPLDSGSHAGKELLGPPSSEIYAGKELLGPPSSASQAGKELLQRPSSSNAGKELLGPPSSASPAPRDLLPTSSTPATAPRTQNLLDRLNPAASNGKRARSDEAELPASLPTRPSLLSRMQLKDDSQQSKRPRSTAQNATNNDSPAAPSLLSRISRDGIPPVTPPILPPSTANTDRAPGSTLSFRNAVTDTGGSSGVLSIFGRAGQGASDTPTPKPDAKDFFSIKHRASNGTPNTPGTPLTPAPTESNNAQGLSIRSSASASTSNGNGRLASSTPQNDDEGVVRKGRGFQRDKEGDISMDFTPPPTRSEQSASPATGQSGFGWTGIKGMSGGKKSNKGLRRL